MKSGILQSFDGKMSCLWPYSTQNMFTSIILVQNFQNPNEWLDATFHRRIDFTGRRQNPTKISSWRFNPVYARFCWRWWCQCSYSEDNVDSSNHWKINEKLLLWTNNSLKANPEKNESNKTSSKCLTSSAFLVFGNKWSLIIWRKNFFFRLYQKSWRDFCWRWRISRFTPSFDQRIFFSRKNENKSFWQNFRHGIEVDIPDFDLVLTKNFVFQSQWKIQSTGKIRVSYTKKKSKISKKFTGFQIWLTYFSSSASVQFSFRWNLKNFFCVFLILRISSWLRRQQSPELVSNG